ncbi:MAG: hypothetical protein K1X88_30630 [Nannocystaceae bacterium]|nr:hypothetical protein [Nannocystaceae bacterium]
MEPLDDDEMLATGAGQDDLGAKIGDYLAIFWNFTAAVWSDTPPNYCEVIN